ncbi:MAG: hypothetical protein ABH817_02315 [archaeon]
MKIKFSTSSQDLDIFLSENEFKNLIREKTKEYHENPWTNPLRGVIRELNAYVFVAYSEDESRFISNEDTPEFKYIDSRPGVVREVGVEVLLPTELGHPYYINLRDEAIIKIKREKYVRVRVPGGSKVGVILEDLIEK